MRRLTLSQARLEIGRLGEWFDREERALALPTKLAHAVRLCLEEAVDNLINYTSTTSEAPPIDIAMGRQGDILSRWSGIMGHLSTREPHKRFRRQRIWKRCNREVGGSISFDHLPTKSTTPRDRIATN